MRALELLLLACCARLALAQAQQQTQAQQQQVRVPPVLPHPEVPVNRTEVPCDVDDEGMEPLYRDNLYPDIEMWRGRAMDMHMLAKQAAAMAPGSPTFRVALIYNNTLYLPGQKEEMTRCERPCDRYTQAAIDFFRYWLPRMPLPNVVFLLSTSDGQKCRYRTDCQVPVFTIAKKYRNLPEGKKSNDAPVAYDILYPEPPLSRSPVAHFHDFPWELKSSKAVWRGTGWCSHSRNAMVGCSRQYTYRLYEASLEFRELADFAFSAGAKWPVVSRMQSADYARFKFLLNLDGMTAAYRLSTLLLMNSVVLKEESVKAEYYYRSLREYEHYLPIYKHNATDVLDVLREYSRPEREPQLQRMAAAAQAFAAKYTCPRARMLYWRRVLAEYKALLPDMDAAIEQHWWPLVRERLRQKAGGSVPAGPKVEGSAGFQAAGVVGEQGVGGVRVEGAETGLQEGQGRSAAERGFRAGALSEKDKALVRLKRGVKD